MHVSLFIFHSKNVLNTKRKAAHLESHQLGAVEEGSVKSLTGVAEARAWRLQLHRAAATEVLLAVHTDMLG